MQRQVQRRRRIHFQLMFVLARGLIRPRHRPRDLFAGPQIGNAPDARGGYWFRTGCIVLSALDKARPMACPGG